ncbi:MAG: RnfABCDGE type electron transport complex subunit G [Acidobacteria bacterium]|nr:RnfABCDGE type electron transport complex subunit G [Acidobacteriota bacterium]
MGKAKPPVAKNIIVLTLITIIAGLALALTYNFTKPAIDEAERANILKSIKFVFQKDSEGNPVYVNAPDAQKIEYKLNPDDPASRVIEFYPGINANNEIVGYAIKNISGIGFGGDIGFMIGIDIDGKINDIYILSMAETPGLGTKIDEPGFKGQFPGKSMATGATLEITKDNSQSGDIVAITGATISSRAMTTCVNQAVKYYLAHKDEIITATKEKINAEGGQK